MLLAYCVLILLAAAFLWFHFTNPFIIGRSLFKNPYRTFIDEQGQIDYVQNYRLRVFTGPIANALGYAKGGFLIFQNTFFKGAHAKGETLDAIIADIHRQRFNPHKPYLISGDQFSVLYPRNLGVFYNQLLNPDTALDPADWERRQRIYLQSVLLAIDGLSASPNPRTTIIPFGVRHAVLTQVHPGGIGSDQVFGLLYALHALRGSASSRDGMHRQATKVAAERILKEKMPQLQFIYDSYMHAVYEARTSLVREGIHLSAARDGVIRSSSFYDNVVMYETIHLAEQLGLKDNLDLNIASIERKIKDQYWNEAKGYYNDDTINHHFSADWLIGYVTGFFKLTDHADLQRTIKTVDYIESTDLVRPFPIKYQVEGDLRVPRIVKWVAPNYGTDVIWSYWGAQYITLLAELYHATGKEMYLKKARGYIKQYDQNILRDKGYAETFDAEGKFLRSTIYKSIRVTGWVVEFEHAKDLVKLYGAKR